MKRAWIRRGIFPAFCLDTRGPPVTVHHFNAFRLLNTVAVSLSKCVWDLDAFPSDLGFPLP